MAQRTSEQVKKEIMKYIAEKRRVVTIKEICDKLKLSRPTVRKYIKQLIKEDWLVEEK